MFTVSDNATMAIRTIIGRSGVPQGAGLRIAADADRGSLHIAVSPAPEPGDTVYDAGADAQLFIAEGAGELLEERTMDVREDDAGRVQFVLDSPQQ
ncbi:adhesin [Paractinoplanes rhizophilus]|uniref:Adhesin n=1 Tax=Paractinoplanes rhizophilus TaxID=1416877 RepID=A0ABW2I367_9ACTN